jgi:hypothetical protein
VREEGIRIRQAAAPDHRSRERSGDGPGPILVVDDDPGSLKLLRVLLQGRGIRGSSGERRDIDEETTRQALAAGGAARYVKPIRSDTFVSLIKTVIGADGPDGTPPARSRSGQAA